MTQRCAPVGVERPAVRLRDARPPDHVPEAARQAVAHLRALRAVVVEVVPTDVAEIPVAEVVEVHRVVHPLLENIRLQQAGHEHRSRGKRSEETQRRKERGKGQRVADPPVDVLAVPWPGVVVRVAGVEEVVQPAPEQPAPLREDAVEDVAMDEVLDGDPGDHPEGHEPESGDGVSRASGDDQQDEELDAIDDRDGIEPAAGLAVLRLEVDAGGKEGFGKRSDLGLQQRIHQQPPGTPQFTTKTRRHKGDESP